MDSEMPGDPQLLLELSLLRPRLEVSCGDGEGGSSYVGSELCKEAKVLPSGLG